MRVICVLLLLIHLAQLHGQKLSKGFSINKMVDGLNPVAMTVDHHDRIWLVEKDGRVLIVERNGELLSDPFITLEVNDFNERGLLGIALHPDMDQQPYVYLYYTVSNGMHNRVSRFTANGDLAVPGSEEILLDLDPLSGAIHNGGAMLFDRHGYLFIATGEAGLSSNSQNTDNLLGKILRIHDDGSIPPDNPYFSEFQGKNRAIWSMGHRNPFNLAYDHVDDLLYASDVGGGEYEEINLIEPGKNYGYPIVEGPIIDQVPPKDYQDPFFAYPYEVGSECAIVALAVYRPDELSFGSEFEGALFFADYCGGYINYLEGGEISSIRTLASGLDRPLNILINNHNGELFFQTRAGQGGGSPEDNTFSNNGELWKLFFKGNGKPEIINSIPDVVRTVGEDIRFEIHAIGADSLEYSWYLNNQLQSEHTSDSYIFNNLSLDQSGSTALCIVKNVDGSDTSNTANITVVSNTRPTIEIATPRSNQTFSAGDTILFTGVALDAEDGKLPDSRLGWSVDFHHNDHTHPFIDQLTGVASGQFIVPTNGETDTNVWIRIHLVAQDLEGLRNRAFVDVLPEFSAITILSNLPASINVDGAIRELPYTFTSMRGLSRILAVEEIQEYPDHLLLFQGWSDGSTENIRTINTSTQADTFHLLFDSLARGNGKGLRAEYFNYDLEHDLDMEPNLVRTDSIIDFGWGKESPSDLIDQDFFSARWTGFIQPLFSEEYTLSIASDDGARIWIDENLVFEHWQPQATTEHFFTYPMIAGKKHSVKMEYFEKDGGAAVHLRWESEHNQREIVPARQMYPLRFAQIQGTLWLDEDANGNQDETEIILPNQTVLLLDAQFNLLMHAQTDSLGIFQFRNALADAYYIRFLLPTDSMQVAPGHGLNEHSTSTLLSAQADSTLQIKFAFVPQSTTAHHHESEGPIVIVYPNPTSNHIDFLTDRSISDISILHLNGRSVLESVATTGGLNTINCSHLPAGTYLIRMKVDDNYIFKKIIKQ